MNLNLKLRNFEPSDLERILGIERASFTWDVYSETRFRKLYEKHPTDFIVAEFEGKVVGYIIAYDSGVYGDFDSLAVDPQCRRLAIGTQLVNFMLDRFRQRCFQKASLEVYVGNESAIQFWQKQGFKITKVIKGFYQGRRHAYQMEREL